MSTETGRQIAYRIRAELVCCDVYDRLAYYRDTSGVDLRFGQYAGHDLCYWGEASARLAESYSESDAVYLPDPMAEAIFEAHLEGTRCPGPCCADAGKIYSQGRPDWLSPYQDFPCSVCGVELDEYEKHFCVGS